MATQTKTWRDFTRWCAARGLAALPAHPWTISAYLRWVDQHQDARAARAALNVISRHHLLKTARASHRAPQRHATVQKTLELIERRAENRGLGSNLFDDDGLENGPAAPQPVSQPVPQNPAEAASTKRQSGRKTLASRPRLVRRRTP